MARLLLGLLVLIWAPYAQAHKASTAYLHLETHGAQLQGRIEIAIRDLDFVLNLDADGDGEIRWGELKAARGRIEDYVLSRLAVQQEARSCSLQVGDMQVVGHSDGNYAVLALAGSCPARISALSVGYRLFFDVDALHRGLAELKFEGSSVGAQNVLFSPAAQQLRFERAGQSHWRVFAQYFMAGLQHVWSGLDHLLFLAGLFLPAVLRRVNGRWAPVADLRTALRDTAFIVTAFTVAHALTLTLAAAGAFTLPSRLVESAVALTVLFAGLNNLVPMVYRELFWLSGVFGLIHGAAVASALIDMGLPGGSRVWALLAFNVGVEAAQLSLLALVILPAFYLRRSAFYRFGVLLPGSVIVTAVGACWFVERSFNVFFGVPLP